MSAKENHQKSVTQLRGFNELPPVIQAELVRFENILGHAIGMAGIRTAEALEFQKTNHWDLATVQTTCTLDFAVQFFAVLDVLRREVPLPSESNKFRTHSGPLREFVKHYKLDVPNKNRPEHVCHGPVILAAFSLGYPLIDIAKGSGACEIICGAVTPENKRIYSVDGKVVPYRGDLTTLGGKQN